MLLEPLAQRPALLEARHHRHPRRRRAQGEEGCRLEGSRLRAASRDR